jgi:GNAT superfamily N-acetyltransferase
VTVADVFLYRAMTATTSKSSPTTSPIEIRTFEPTEIRELDGSDDQFDELIADDLVVGATTDGCLVGYLFVSFGRRISLPFLRTTREFDGAYLWGLFVDPSWRRHGIATALVTHGLETAKAEFDTGDAYAMIAADNLPSKRAFRTNGFDPQTRYRYCRLFGLEWRSQSPIDT